MLNFNGVLRIGGAVIGVFLIVILIMVNNTVKESKRLNELQGKELKLTSLIVQSQLNKIKLDSLVIDSLEIRIFYDSIAINDYELLLQNNEKIIASLQNQLSWGEYSQLIQVNDDTVYSMDTIYNDCMEVVYVDGDMIDFQPENFITNPSMRVEPFNSDGISGIAFIEDSLSFGQLQSSNTYEVKLTLIKKPLFGKPTYQIEIKNTSPHSSEPWFVPVDDSVLEIIKL